MSIRVGPDVSNPTHHIAISDRKGNKVGFILCDDNGKDNLGPGSIVEIPVETTDLKQTSGSSSYEQFDYPYSPIVQDDLSGGRGSPDFERDSTKFLDSSRT